MIEFILTELSSSEWVVFLLSLAIAADMIILLLFLRRRIFNPLRKIKHTAYEIGKGNLDARIPLQGSQDVKDLVNSLNNMISQLQTYHRAMEFTVKEKATELAHKVDELSLEKAKDEAILASAGEGMLVTDKDIKVIFANTAAQEILGIAEKDLIGKPVADAYEVYNEQDQLIPKTSRAILTSLQTGNKVAHTSIYHKLTGEKLYIYVTATPILLGNEITGVIQIIRDVTHEKEIDRMKTEFISLASHQLRTPLSALKWLTEMLLHGDAGKLTSKQEELTTDMAESIERMIELVNGLLNISRLESGRIIIDPQPTDLFEVIKSLEKELQVKIQEKNIKFVAMPYEFLPPLNIDPKLMRQVYLNLFTNAIKYTPAGGRVTVFVSLKDNAIISQVTDTGYGIPAAQQNRVFQKFFRAENILNVETDGTGLGLYLVKSIIDTIGGKIWFTSEEGKGTSFWISIPARGILPKKGEVSLD